MQPSTRGGRGGGRARGARASTMSSPAAADTATATDTQTPPTASAPTKRRRVSRACDQCRAMREKCDGNQPQCSSCVSQSRTCTYKTSPKKRGVQTGYIRTLELTLSSLLVEVPGCAEALDGLFNKQDAAQRLFNPETGGQQDLERHKKLHRKWHKSRARKEINRLLLSADGPGAAQPASDKDSDSGGSDSEAGGGPGLASTIPPRPQAAATCSPSDNTLPSPLSGAGGLPDDAGDVAPERQPFRLPPNHWRLLDIYFSYIHCWFPILERQDVLKTVYQYERELGQPTSAPAVASSSAAMTELWSVLALASFQDASSRTPGAQIATSSGRPDPSWQPNNIYNMARQMIPLDDGPFEIQYARALLLLALVNIGRRRYNAARVLVALSLRMAQDGDCMLREGHAPLPRKAFDAVLAGCCILDAFLAAVQTAPRCGYSFARPCASAPVPEDGWDEWQPWVPCAGFGIQDAAAAERSPAYSLTTFNQLHSLLHFLQCHINRASAAAGDHQGGLASPSNDGGHGFDSNALDRVLRPDVPFSRFIRSTGRTSAAAPSAYVLRIIFLWIHILLAPPDSVGSATESHVFLLTDVLEQFVARFGAASAPPILVPCVRTMVDHAAFKLLPDNLQQRLSALADGLEAVWHAPSARQPGPPPQQSQPAPTAAAFPSISASPEAGQRSPSHRRRPSFLDTPPTQQQPRTIYGKPAGPASFIFHPLPISPQATAHNGPNAFPVMQLNPINLDSMPPPPLAVDQNFGGGTVDYDALLDDLSAVDYLDHLDADVGSQFMANLGFAPGSDNLGNMMGDFGSL